MAAPSVSGWSHHHVEANGIRVHYVRHGAGAPLVLLHGWPEFWFAWHKNMGELAEHFDVIVPDLRRFGDTEKPGLPDPPSGLPEALAEDLGGLIGALGIESAGLVSQDRKSTRLNSSHANISYAVFCLKKKNRNLLLTHLT